jgi:hypothetical protein
LKSNKTELANRFIRYNAHQWGQQFVEGGHTTGGQYSSSDDSQEGEVRRE